MVMMVSETLKTGNKVNEGFIGQEAAGAKKTIRMWL